MILAGPNGAGKSTLAPVLLRDRLRITTYVNADTIAAGLSAFAPAEMAMRAGRIMLGHLRELAARRRSFAFESTLATHGYGRWLRRLADEGYRVRIEFLWLRSPDLAVERVRQRVRSGGHDVPESTVRRRYRRGVRSFLGLYSKLAESWCVLDNSGIAAPVPIAVGSFGKTISVEDADRWEWFQRAGDDADEA